ncbi:MAG: tRNA (guanosine(46)-N7)-methyltransferase TrmB [Sporolactobacillus sp.]
MRVRHKPWARGKMEQYPEIVIVSPKTCSGEWYDVFGREAPLHVEIGTGKGQFITEMARRHPEMNFVGIEINESIMVSALNACLDAELKNLRLILGDARLLTEFFAENEVDALYLNFCDPWPKARHEKRRLTYSAFLAQYDYVLKTDGLIQLKTDNEGLFTYSLESFSQYGFVLSDISLDLHRQSDPENVVTEYEEKFAAQNKRIFRCRAKRPDERA